MHMVGVQLIRFDSVLINKITTLKGYYMFKTSTLFAFKFDQTVQKLQF